MNTLCLVSLLSMVDQWISYVLLIFIVAVKRYFDSQVRASKTASPEEGKKENGC